MRNEFDNSEYEEGEFDYEDDELSEEEKYEDTRRMMFLNLDDECWTDYLKIDNVAK